MFTSISSAVKNLIFLPLKEERYSKRQNDFSRFYVKLFLNFNFILDNVIIDEGDIIKSTKLKQIEAPEENAAVQKAVVFEGTWKNNFTDEAYKTCYICFNQFLGLHQLTKHLRLHDTGPYACPECSRQVPNGLTLHEHLRSHFKGLIHSDGLETNQCDEPGCREIFKTKSALLKHNSLQHSLAKQKTYRCTECTFVCYSAKVFTDHMLNIHNRKPFQCDQCSMGYNHKANLEDHIKAKHGSKEPVCIVQNKK